MKLFDNLKKKVKETFEPFFDPAPKDTPENHANELVRQAAEHLPESIKNMSVPELARVINKMNTVNKWNITKTMATGKIKKHGPASGLGIIHSNGNSDAQIAKSKKKIAKGLIQCNEEEIEKRWQLRQERLKKREAVQ